MPPVLYQTLLGGLMLGLLALELTNADFRAALRRPSDRRRRNVAYLFAALAVGALLPKIGAAARLVVPPQIDWGTNRVVEVALCFAIAELLGYGLHYVKHASAPLWRFHFQHHRETRYDLWLVTHTHGFEVLISGSLSAVVLAALGFSPFALDAYLLFYAVANTYQHSSHDYSLGWLDKLIVNPSYHRLHHAVGTRANYGNTLTLWDVVFRTAQWPLSRRAPDVVIGIEAGPEPWGFWDEMRYPFSPPSAKTTAGTTTRSHTSASEMTTLATIPK